MSTGGEGRCNNAIMQKRGLCFRGWIIRQAGRVLRALMTRTNSPRVTQGPGAGVGRGVRGERAVELRNQRDAVRETKLSADRRQREVPKENQDQAAETVRTVPVAWSSN